MRDELLYGISHFPFLPDICKMFQAISTDEKENRVEMAICEHQNSVEPSCAFAKLESEIILIKTGPP
jgi:hypothetical protein